VSPIVFATFNVKDLFDATDDPSRARLDAKLSALARMLEAARADVVGLQEVGSADVVRALAARVPGLGYGEPIMGTGDARGIRCAILTRLPVLYTRVHQAEALPFPAFSVKDPLPYGARMPLRRGVVHARVQAGDLGAVDVLVAHFKSNRSVWLEDAAGKPVEPKSGRDFAEGQLRSLVWRCAEALFSRTLVDEAIGDPPGAHVVFMGDLNDGAGSQVARVLCGAGEGALFPCAEKAPEGTRWSILWKGRREQLDHVLATRALHARVHSARFLNEDLKDHSTLGPDEFIADSDHAPLVITFG
jgi:predicted extracellular nuclease